MLNPVKGNMYGFVTDTWNVIKGKCSHDCSYCYMKKWGEQNPVRFDSKEMKTDLGSGKFIFIGSSCDMWADDIPFDWIVCVIYHKMLFGKNKYLLQTKNPKRFETASILLSAETDILCTTIETNRFIPEIMANSPHPEVRAADLSVLSNKGFETMVTIEPIIDFDMDKLLNLVHITKATQVNIGADSLGHHLPEPAKEKVIELISELEKFTKVYQKKNLRRLVA